MGEVLTGTGASEDEEDGDVVMVEDRGRRRRALSGGIRGGRRGVGVRVLVLVLQVVEV